MEALGAILGIIAIAVLYGAVMLAYFGIKKKYPSAKYWVEFLTIGFSLALSIAIKMTILSIVDTENTSHALAKGFANILHSVYSGFGGLTFEGLDRPSEVGGTALQCLYTGTSVFASLIFFSVITAKANYEIFSIVRLLFTPKKNKNIYLFTAVTEDALALANSVSDKNPNDLVIFTGDELEGFDKRNELHREIMANGYLYWSFYKDKNSDTSLIFKLRLFVFNNVCEDKFIEAASKYKSRFVSDTSEVNDTRIHIFAMSNNKQLSGLESVNGDVVFGEISALTTEFLTSKRFALRPRPIVSFYILTDNSINYSAYAKAKKEVIINALSRCNIESTDALVEELTKHFQLNVINDAVLAGKDLVHKRVETYSEELLLSDPVPYEGSDNEYRAMVLGFGQNGQQALKSLFINTSYVDSQNRPSRFIADVYDDDGSKFGLFESTHPMFVCHECDKSEAYVKEDYSPQDYAKLQKMYGYVDHEEFKEKIDAYMGFPIVAFHKASTFGQSFIKYLDRKTGTDKSSKTLYKAFIITLGDDEANIAMANALIEDIKHEFLSADISPSAVQTLFVNIRNKQNIYRLNWTELDKKTFKSLKVIPFGAKIDIYSYDSIVEDRVAKEVNFGYNLLESNNAKHLYAHISEVFEREEVLSEDFKDDLQAIRKEVVNDNRILHSRERTIEWLSIDIFAKESNVIASTFKPYFNARLHLLGGTKGGNLVNLSNVEHTRWCRFHMAHGWVYSKYTKEQKALRRSIKEHDCLTVFDAIGKKNNDLVNVAIFYED